jgi:hypothetical protein
MELFDREVLPSQKDRMAFMKELLQSQQVGKKMAAAARVRAQRDAETGPVLAPKKPADKA